MSYQLYNQDSFEVIKTLPPNSVHICVEDMPYFKTTLEFDCELNDGKPIDYTKRKDIRLVEDYLERYLEARQRLCMANGVLVLTSKQPFTTVLNYVLLPYLVDEFVWAKSNHTNQFVVKRKIASRHEMVSVFAFGKGYTFNPQFTKGVPYKGFASENGKQVGKVLGSAKSVHYENEGTRYAHSIQHFGREYGLHPVQKPVGLMEMAIRWFSNEGDTVFDGFMGSGATIKAAMNCNRHSIGCEIDARQYQIAENSLK